MFSSGMVSDAISPAPVASTLLQSYVVAAHFKSKIFSPKSHFFVCLFMVDMVLPVSAKEQTLHFVPIKLSSPTELPFPTCVNAFH